VRLGEDTGLQNSIYNTLRMSDRFYTLKISSVVNNFQKFVLHNGQEFTILSHFTVQIKVKSPFTPWRHTEGVEVSCKLTLAIYGGEWSAICPGCCTFGENPCIHFTVGWVGPKVSTGHSE